MTLKELKEITAMVKRETIHYMRGGPAKPEHLTHLASYLTMKAYHMTYTPWKVNQPVFARLVSNTVYRIAGY